MPATDFLTSFMSAAAAPIVKPVVWPDTIGQAHPLRSVQLFLRFWPVWIATLIQSKISGTGWYSELFWTMAAAGVCRLDGTPAFADKWDEVWAEHVDKFNSAVILADLRLQMIPTNASVEDVKTSRVLPEGCIGSYDDSGVLSVPPVDYVVLGNWLKTQYDNPQGELIFKPLVDQSLAYNGWVLSEGKNSETTGTSVPSGEKQSVGASA